MIHAIVLAAAAGAVNPKCAPMLADFKTSRVATSASGLRTVIVKPGARRLTAGQVAIVGYTLCLQDGKLVDSSGKGTFAFTLGEKQVVQGFEEAAKQVGLGGDVEAWLPARLGYGAKGSSHVIAPNTDLLFRIHLAGLAETSLSVQLKHAYDKGGLTAMQAAYESAASKRFAGMYAREDDLTSLGYRFINKKHYDAAIAVFTYNAERFPDSWNCYDSLGDAYEVDKQNALAIANYKKALALNPKDQNAIEQLKLLQP